MVTLLGLASLDAALNDAQKSHPAPSFWRRYAPRADLHFMSEVRPLHQSESRPVQRDDVAVHQRRYAGGESNAAETSLMEACAFRGREVLLCSNLKSSFAQIPCGKGLISWLLFVATGAIE